MAGTNNATNMRSPGTGQYSPASTVQAGTPNGTLAGFVGDICYDSTNSIGYTCTVSGTASTAVWAADGSASASFTWNNTTGTSQGMAVQNGYISNNVALTTFTLPTVATIGQRVAVEGSGAGGWTIAQNAGQLIHFGIQTTTTGTGGSLSSTNQYDGLELICITANTTWKVKAAPMGNITYV